jgi:hypothetical protein
MVKSCPGSLLSISELLRNDKTHHVLPMCTMRRPGAQAPCVLSQRKLLLFCATHSVGAHIHIPHMDTQTTHTHTCTYTHTYTT